MTTTARGAVRERVAEEEGGAEQERPFEGIRPLLLAAMMARREEREGIHPLLLAAMMARREDKIFKLFLISMHASGLSQTMVSISQRRQKGLNFRLIFI